MNLLKPLAAIGLLATSASALANDPWFVRAGFHNVDPKSDNGELAGGALQASIGSDVRPTVAIGRFLNDDWAVEVLAALPFDHEVRLNGTKAADFKHLPPTVSAQYYFGEPGGFRPFIGAGLNYTWTFDQRETGPLEGTRLKIGNSFGLAAQLGVLAQVNDRFHLVADVRWIDIDASISVDGTDVGDVAVDPLVYGLSLGWRF